MAEEYQPTDSDQVAVVPSWVVGESNAIGDEVVEVHETFVESEVADASNCEESEVVHLAAASPSGENEEVAVAKCQHVAS